jgi:hypothetical protein
LVVRRHFHNQLPVKSSVLWSASHDAAEDVVVVVVVVVVYLFHGVNLVDVVLSPKKPFALSLFYRPETSP